MPLKYWLSCGVMESRGWAVVRRCKDRGFGPLLCRVGAGLTADGRELVGFWIADHSRVFYPATAVISENTVLVSSPEVSAPVAVRYAWADNPEEANLYNSAGLPASSFRTDTWEV